MDASKLTQKRAQASNTYRSNWQPRDASEITMRRRDISNKNNNVLVAGATHHGPIEGCCSDATQRGPRAVSPTKGFSTTYEGGIVALKKAGCADCNDPNFGKAGGVQLITCDEVATILAPEPNPVKGVKCYCADPGIYRQPFPVDCSIVQPAYTGANNNVTTYGQNYGHLPKQQYPYPSG
jgi:hypothetical protein